MNETLPRIAYLILLLIAVSGYLIVEMRGNFGKSIRQMLAWGLIFLGVIAGFGLWDDIRQDIAPPQVIEGKRIELPRAGDGHFYIDLRLNGNMVRFMVDTGASDIALRRSDAQKAGIDTNTLRYTGFASTANGEVSTATTTIGLLQIGDIQDEDVRANVVQGDLDVSLLGMSYLRRFSRVGIEGNTMVLER